MAVNVKAPTRRINTETVKIFLVGSIDMGKAVDWQTMVADSLSSVEDVVIFNPRRDDWDSTWVQDISNPQFKEQVTWELDHIDESNLVVVYFDPAGPAPITLMELGILSQQKNKHVFVYCPEGYWRRGNVQVLCNRNSSHMVMVDTVEELLNRTRSRVDFLLWCKDVKGTDIWNSDTLA